MDPRSRVTIEDLLKRKRSFFIRYEVNVNTWDAEDFDPEVDFFDLEDMLASRYWLKRLEAVGKLTKEESKKLSELEQKFRQLGIPEFVKTRFPGVYERWIKQSSIGFWERVLLSLSSQFSDELQLPVAINLADKPLRWKRGKYEDNQLQSFAA